MGWFENYRLAWIGEMLSIYGYINREHIERKFNISTPQASHDLRQFQKLHPEACTYNTRTKRYEANHAM